MPIIAECDEQSHSLAVLSLVALAEAPKDVFSNHSSATALYVLGRTQDLADVEKLKALKQK